MKKYLILLTISILLAPATQARSSSAQLKVGYAQDADSLYRIKDYQGAAAGYESVLTDGFASADLYYNLGNTYYRMGQFGRAILNYERALRLEPGMSDARQNLELANSKTADRITSLPKIFLVNWYDALVTRLSPSSWRTIVIILVLIVAIAVFFLVTSREISLRKGSLATLISAGILLILAVWFLIASTQHFNSHAEAIVLEPSVTVKSSPEHQSVDKLILHEGTKVTITESLAGWHKITLSDGTTGWCQQENIERI